MSCSTENQSGPAARGGQETELTRAGRSKRARGIDIASSVRCGAGDLITAQPEERGLLDAINRLRKKGADCGRSGAFAPVPSVILSPELFCAARAQANDMGARGFFSHISPEGLDARARAARAGFAGQVGENLAWGQIAPQQVVDEWRRSPIHCKTMLWSAFTAVGIGYHRTPAGRPLWAAIFGTLGTTL